MVLCDGPCNCAFHQNCLDPPVDVTKLPEDEGWLCPACDCKVGGGGCGGPATRGPLSGGVTSMIIFWGRGAAAGWWWEPVESRCGEGRLHGGWIQTGAVINVGRGGGCGIWAAGFVHERMGGCRSPGAQVHTPRPLYPVLHLAS